MAAVIGTTCINSTISPGKGSGSGLRSTNSNHAQHAWLNDHMTMPAAIRVQKKRVWPPLSDAFRTHRMAVAPMTSMGTRSPMATRKKGLGKIAGAPAKASSRPSPQKSDEICSLDTAFHSMTFPSGCLDPGQITGGYCGNEFS